jgi:hypothetical protein
VLKMACTICISTPVIATGREGMGSSNVLNVSTFQLCNFVDALKDILNICALSHVFSSNWRVSFSGVSA